VAKVKDKDPNPDSESNPKNIEKRRIINVDPTTAITIAIIQPEEPIDPEEGENLFHLQMWVKGTLFHFIVDRNRQKNLISVDAIK
jgi:hypothetical protein